MKIFLNTVFFLVLALACLADSPLAPLKLDHPRDTVHSFIQAMNDYKQGLDTGDKALQSRIDDAARTLDLTDVPFIVRKEKGHEAAKLLKEVIDRVIVINYDLIPDNPNRDIPWRLKDTEIKVFRVDSGEHKGEFLFSKETVERAKEFYEKVKDLPYLANSGQGAGYKAPWTERMVPHWARGKFLGLEKWQWLGLFLAILVGLISKFLASKVVKVLKKFAPQRADSQRQVLLDAIEKPSGLFLASLFWLLSLQLLQLEGLTLKLLTFVVQVILSVSIIWAAYRLCDVVTAYLLGLAQKTESDLDDHLVPLVSRSLRIFVVVMGTLLAIDNLGFDVMSLIAGLGLGGLAFALAAKDTAANLLGSVMIILDRPFRIGDWIKVGDMEGTVVNIGFRSTRLRTFYDSLVSVPNSALANMNIDNMGLRQYRRVRATLGLTYNTPPDKIETFTAGIRELLIKHPAVRKDNFHVVFQGYNDSSLDIMLYYFLDVPDWASELKYRQELYLEILKLAQNIGVSFAFPSRSIYMESGNIDLAAKTPTI